LKYESLPRTFETGYTIELLVKDLGIAAGLAGSVEFESDLFRLVVGRFAEARADIGGESDLTASLRHWEHRAGQELPASAATTRPGRGAASGPAASARQPSTSSPSARPASA
jgi:hypothetical protein